MTDIALETTRALVLVGIVVFLWKAGRDRFELSRVGWNFIVAGFGLLLFGSLLDITDNFDSLNKYAVIGDTELEAFLEKFVGFLGGFIFLAIGLFKWIPKVQGLSDMVDARTKYLKEAKEQAEAAEELFSKAYHSSPALFTISSPKDSRHIDVKDAWSSITGYSREEARQKTGLELGIWAKPDDRMEFLERIKNQGIVRNFETVFRAKNGDEKDMLLSGEFIDFRGEDCLLVVGLDISERKEIDRLKHEFISIASHELRTPLTSLKGALGLIHSGTVGQVPEAMETLLEVAHRNSERLGRLIDDILDMEKLGAGKMEFSMQPMAVPSLIRQAISEHEGYGFKHGVSFVINGDVPKVAVLVDEDRLMQVFSNLMSNAAKFSSKGTIVWLSARERDHDVRISITDKGPGIPKEFQEKIFEKFTRTNNSDSGLNEETGLGLSIAKAVVERHGGDLGFQTETDVGTTFYFDLQKADHQPSL